MSNFLGSRRATAFFKTRCGKLIALANTGSATAPMGWEMPQSRDILTCYTPMHFLLVPLLSFNMYEETRCTWEFL